MIGMSLGTFITQGLSVGQRIAISCKIHDTRSDFLAHLHQSENYRPSAECEGCRYILNSVEILKGFTKDPLDVTTVCPKCSTRFAAKLTLRTDHGTAFMGFYCPSQTLFRLKDWQDFSTEDIRKKDQAVYRSALFHFGGIKKAFSLLEIDYSFDEIADWQLKIQDFLGKLPDIFIANAVAQPVRLIRKIRNSLDIPKFKRSDLLEE
jgi:hypothetical protein